MTARFPLSAIHSPIHLLTAKNHRHLVRLSLARNMGRGEAAAAAIRERHPKCTVSVALCDVSSMASVKECVASLKGSPPDVLLANAGVMLPRREVTKEGVEMTFATCTLGHHLMASLVKPKRFVFVSGDIYAISTGGRLESISGLIFSPKE